MSLADTWQLPAGDDIDPDSLEYLFGPKRLRGETPWVRIARDPEPVARISPEMVRLQAKLETMLSQLEIFTNKLAKSNHELGFARAQIAERDKQLELQAEYRVRAALAIMSDVERQRFVSRIADLEEQVLELLKAEKPAPAPSLPVAPALSPSIPAKPIEAAELRLTVGSARHNSGLERMFTRHSEDERGFELPLMPITYFLVMSFAAMVLLTILI